MDDETTTYSQAGVFRLVRDHHVQKGPFFDKPTDVAVEAASGTVTTKTWDKDGKLKLETAHSDLPADLANGFVGILLLNVPSTAAPFKVSVLAPFGGKGRLVKLAIAPDSEQSFRVGGRRRKATVFRIRVELGGITGIVAPIVGKDVKDIMVWVVEGEAPAFIRQVGQLYAGGPVVSVELPGIKFGEAR